MEQLNDLLHRLHAHEVEFVVIGGFAAVMHGSTLVTRDLDICCRLDGETLRRIQAAVADLHPMHRMRPDLPFLLTPELVRGLKNLYLKTDLGVLDILGEIKGVGNYEEVSKRAMVAELPFGECRVLDLETLIRAKKAMNRDHDRITVKQLLAIQKQKIDR